ncbi:S-type pyocin domain-containing protein [Rahnella sp. ChDrAdgB13]|uniref:S-type pyocin domain-containing protein n=1 Tax=Rahnella sp. ChDrAdgB13 TaxID=1850581 RepID=UPI001FCB6BBD|nr:S-type pyocin domain-containing protein [Rahnella sp. ChDrAdgB13]
MRVTTPKGQWLGSGPSPAQIAQEKQAALMVARQAERAAEAQRQAEERDRNRVFAKSCLRGDGCNDAGEAREPHTNFATMGLFRSVPAASPATDNDVPQHAQTAKKKPAEPAPKSRSALYKWWFGNHEEMKYVAATAAAASMARAQVATAGAEVLELVGGAFTTSGTWAVTAGRVAAGGIGAPVAALMVGMMPGRLNDGEQDYIDRMRAEQMREVPSRVRFTWESDAKGNAVPRGWHTPPGKDMVRLRRMEWDNSRKAYTFTTEEEKPITIIWTPDHSGVVVPSNTGNQARPVLPSSVIVDPLPESTGITTTTSPAPEEKSFADYILILPMPNIPPIYIYLSKAPVEFLEVELYSDFKRRSREGKYEADHMPSAAAVKAYLKANYPGMTPEDIELASQDVAAIVIPKEVHQKVSETYGGRNTPAQIDLDSRNLRAAADRNLDAIKPALKERGATESQIEEVRAKMHELNGKMGLY